MLVQSASQVLMDKIRSVFPTVAPDLILAQLRGYGEARHQPEQERVWLAILKLSEECGHADVVHFVEQARQDYRDVLAWAEYPRQLRLPPDASGDVKAEAARLDRLQYQRWLEAGGSGRA